MARVQRDRSVRRGIRYTKYLNGPDNIRCVVTAKTQYSLKNAKVYFEEHLASVTTTMKVSVWLANGLDRAPKGLDCLGESRPVTLCACVRINIRLRARS